MSNHKENLEKLLKYKNLLSNYGSKFVQIFGIPFLIIYAVMNSIICMLALGGAAYIETESDLFIQQPYLIDVILISENTLILLPLIAVIIYMTYIIIKLLENHYTKMAQKEGLCQPTEKN